MHLQNFKKSFEISQNEEKLELSSATSLGQQSRHCISMKEEDKILFLAKKTETILVWKEKN